MNVIRSAWALLALAALGGCGTLDSPGAYEFETLDDVTDGFADSASGRRSAGSGDTVTNGLQNNASRGLSNSSDAVTEGKQGFGYTHFGISTFQDNYGDGLPDTRLPDFTAPPTSGNKGTVTTPTRKPATQPGEPAAPVADRKMVYQGQMQVSVAQVEEAIERYTRKVTEWGGHLGSRDNATITVRVPAAKFNEAVAELRGYGRVLGETMQANDVTRQHLDLTIRLDNAQKSRERLLALLQKAEKVEDMLKIEEQLHRLTEQIERMTGELRFLNDQVAMSTLTAAFYAVSTAPPDKRGKPASMFQWINRIGVEPLRRAF